jgi:hypothetical protein
VGIQLILTVYLFKVMFISFLLYLYFFTFLLFVYLFIASCVDLQLIY